MAETAPGPGILRTDIYNIRFYEKSPFYGSFRGMHYRIAQERDPGETGKEPDGAAKGPDGGPARYLCVTTWPGPYNFETTDDSLKVSARFEFSNEGLDAVTDYLNQFYREHFA